MTGQWLLKSRQLLQFDTRVRGGEMIVAFVVAALGFVCCPENADSHCPCGVSDLLMATRCGCSSCPDNYFGPSCSGLCDCYNGNCSSGAWGNGLCQCDKGWAGTKCNFAVPYVDTMSGVECVSGELPSHVTCTSQPRPYLVTLHGGNFGTDVSVVVVDFSQEDPFNEIRSKPFPQCDVLSVNDTSIACNVTQLNPYPTDFVLHVHVVEVFVNGVSSLIGYRRLRPPYLTLSRLTTATMSLTISPTLTTTNSLSHTLTATQTPTLSTSLSASLSPTETVTVTATDTPTGTTSLTASSTATESISASASATSTATLSLSRTSSASLTRTPTLSSTPTMTATPTLTQSASITKSSSLTETETTTQTPTFSVSPTLSRSGTPSVSLSPSASITLTPTTSRTITLSDTETDTTTATETLTATATLSETVTVTPLRTECLPLWHHPPHCSCGPWHSDDCDCDAETCVTCHATWYGANCTQQCADSHCGGHGRCDDGPAGTGKCACDDGWTGSSCAIAVPVITLLEPSGTCQPTEDVAADGSTVFRADCRHEPATITVHGRNFQLTANNVTFTDGAACAVVRTLSAQLLTCLLAEPLDPGNYTAVVAFEVGGESATSEPRTLEVSLATSTPSITLTPTLTVSDSLVPLCTAEHPWDGVPCLCDGAAEQALCGASEASSLVCTSSPANASAKTCETFPKCVPDQHLPDCLCLEAPDGALCEDGDPHTADEECNRGQCVGVPICDEGRSVTDNCTCTEAAKKTRCAAERACDGEGQCLEDLESLRVSVTKSSFSTTGLKVPVVVSFETGLLRAHDVLLVIWINASEDAVSLSEMASCGRLTAGQMAGQASTGITFTCARGNLAENYEESITIEVSPVVFGAERVPITAEVYSSDIFQAKDRHVANASVVLPVADLSVEILAEGVEDVDWKFVPRVVVCRIRNKGPAVAAGVSLSLQTEGGWVLPGGVILFNESIGSSGEVVVPLETLLPRDGNTSALYLSVRAEVSMGGVALATNERLVDPVAADNAAFVAFGPFHQPQPEPTPQRPDGLPGAPGTTPLPFAFEPASDPWLRPSQSLPAFVLYACLFVSSILTLTHFRAPALTRHQLLAHAMWNPPAHKPKGTLPPLDRIPD
ncbi:cellulosomal scaffoldin anchoring protein [Diplonema papillatum]|nr:cellulosomal scaffoldin anchoring protein [Diplonema papillatum]